MKKRPQQIKNVIFLTIDSLRYDRLNYAGYPIRQSPTINYLAKNGINCVNTFTHGCPSQFAFPSIFTSTLPLSNGGYDRGIKDRDASLVEVLRDNNFYTCGFSTSYWISKFFYYHRGFTEFHQVLGIDYFWKNIKSIYIDHLVDTKNKGLITDKQFMEKLSFLFKETIEYAIEYHEEIARQPNFLRRNRDIHRYEYDSILKLLSSELEYLRKNMYSLNKVDEFYHKMSKVGVEPFMKSGHTRKLNFREKLIYKFREILTRNLIKDTEFRSVSAEYLKDIIIDWIDKNSRQPFFLWTHFLDVHNGNFTTGRLNFPPIFRNFSDRLRMAGKYYGDITYDAAVKYVDKQIGKIILFLKQNKLLDNTLIVITSDHGNTAGAPGRNLRSAGNFYEEFVKIPLIFYNPNLTPQTISNLCCSMDIAPTILSLLGLPPAKEFCGLDVTSPRITQRKYIILEHTYRGACDIKHKPIYLSVRTNQYKYIWREFIDKKDVWAKNKLELYDLGKDPWERINVINVPEYKDVEEELEKVVEDRFKEVGLVNRIT